jgi:hypothetical protein
MVSRAGRFTSMVSRVRKVSRVSRVSRVGRMKDGVATTKDRMPTTHYLPTDFAGFEKCKLRVSA